MRETAYAKVNLALHVRAREADGYHALETVFAFAEDGDTLTAAPGEGLTLALEGPFAASLSTGDDNLVVAAARMLAARFNVSRGAALTLTKRLPVAAGIGGGSADAAAALRLLTRFWDIPCGEADMIGLAADLGADIPACIASRTARGEGRGDRLTPIRPDPWTGTPLLLVNPGVPMPTGPVFAGWDGVDRGPLDDVETGRNDLAAPAIAIAPVIEQALAALKPARLARMSGSGATCFGLYESIAARDAAAARVASLQPGWWTLSSRLR